MSEKIQFVKSFMTYDEQVVKLSSKNLCIPDIIHCTSLLKKFGYFDLVSGYKKAFKNKDGTYKKNTTIDDIFALYNFDDELRKLFLSYILKIEKHLKVLIAYTFCSAYGENQQSYLLTCNYDYHDKNKNGIQDLIKILTDTIKNSKNYPYITHQKNNYGNVPLWAIMKTLTLGNVSKMYSFLTQPVKIEVTKELHQVNEGMLTQMLNILARVRNVCAHNERLFNYTYGRNTIEDSFIHTYFDIPKKGKMFIKAKMISLLW